MVLFPMNTVCLDEPARLLQPCCCQPKDKVNMWKRMADKGTWNLDWPHQSHCFLNKLDEMMSFNFLPCAAMNIWYMRCDCFGVIPSYLAKTVHYSSTRTVDQYMVWWTLLTPLLPILYSVPKCHHPKIIQSDHISP